MPVALVTGASRGIGAACAQRLAAEGWDLGLTYAHDRASCEHTAGVVRLTGRRAIALRVEAREATSLEAAVAEIERELGPLTAVVVNAGTTRDALAVRMSAGDWREPIEVNLEGTAHAIRATAARMLPRGEGAIVNVASVAGLAGIGDLIATCTSQHSRNRHAGELLARGASPAEVEQQVGQVVEGLHTAYALHDLAGRLGIDMPVTENVYQVLEGLRTPQECVADLMGRAPKRERHAQ